MESSSRASRVTSSEGAIEETKKRKKRDTSGGSAKGEARGVWQCGFSWTFRSTRGSA
jgi:hypothetical protein